MPITWASVQWPDTSPVKQCRSDARPTIFLIGGTVAGLIAGMPVPRHPVRRICTPKYVQPWDQTKVVLLQEFVPLQKNVYAPKNIYPCRKLTPKYVSLLEINNKIYLPLQKISKCYPKILYTSWKNLYSFKKFIPPKYLPLQEICTPKWNITVSQKFWH